MVDTKGNAAPAKGTADSAPQPASPSAPYTPLYPTSGVFAPDKRLDLRGRFDMHVHTAPDLTPRHYTDIQLVDAAAQAGAAGLVLKAHHGSTEARAYLCNQYVAEHYPESALAVFGSVVLNTDVGGLNPRRVETVLDLGGKEVWLLTIDAKNDRAKHGKQGGLTVYTEAGRLAPELHEIFSLVREHDAVLATGHISPAESYDVIKAARAAGARHIVVTHPEFWVVGMTFDEQRQLIDEFDVIMERCYRQPRKDGTWPSNLEVNLRAIHELGYANTMIDTDSGQTVTPAWEDGFTDCVNFLYACGVPEAQIDYMTKTVPARLLGVEA